MFYTYAHYRADDNRIFYIGKGKGSRYKSISCRNIHWKRTVSLHGFKSEVLCQWDTEDEAFNHEKFLIKTFRELGHKLVNITDGGEGSSGMKLSDARKQKIKEHHLTRDYATVFTAEARAKIVSTHTGKYVSDETRRKQSESGKGRVVTEETREKFRKIFTGRKNPKNWKAVYCVEYDVTFPNLSTASCLTGASMSLISQNCNGQLKHAKQLHFRYVDDNS